MMAEDPKRWLVDHYLDEPGGPHPSYFTLALFATGSPRMPAVGAHLGDCTVCRNTVEALALERGKRLLEKP